MAPNLSTLRAYQSSILGIAGISAAVWIIAYGKMSKRNKKKLRPEDAIQYLIADKTDKRAQKAHINAIFFKQLKALLRIIIPGVWSMEAALLAVVAGSLVARSISDIWLIRNVTIIESTIIAMNRAKFKSSILNYMVALPLIAVVNNVLKWSLGELKLRFRLNLSHHLYSQYLKGFTFYKMANLDSRISNADQLLTTDIDKFCDSVTDLYSNISKPVLDIFIYVYGLTKSLGGQTPSILILYLMVSGVFLTHIRKPTGSLTVQEQKLEGEFRYVNSRLITNSEEIAFYQGNNREKLTILASLSKLTQHLRKFLEFRVGMGIIDNLIAKYIATVVGFYAVSIPFFTKNHPVLAGDEGERLKNYYTYGRMLIKLAEAIGRLVLAGRELSRLAGFTSRMTELTHVLKELNAGRYERTMVSNSSSADSVIGPNKGIIQFQDDIIKFNRVPLVTPNGDVLIKALIFEVRRGVNVLVYGPNGCGKSSIFRILGELWPVWGGTLIKPPKGKLFYIPQRPYMTLGTLRDQIIYPHTYDEMQRRGRSDTDIHKYLEIVKLSYLLVRENGLDAVEDWIDVLSGGEKQRIAMARLFYHCPTFAILDECTSAVSADVEGSMYEYCKEAGITLLTVSHRKTLWKYHEFYLHIDGRGGYDFGKLSDREVKD